MKNRIDENLSSELSEVKTSAQELIKAVAQHNFLPEDFPTQQLELIAKSLCGLIEGSLEGARLPLEHAGVRVSEIRRRFFLHSTNGHNEEEREFEVPSLERGDALDAKFSSLLSSISTALDAYREQARVEFESHNTSEYMEILPAFPRRESGEPDIQKQINEIDKLSGYAHENLKLHHPQIEDLAVSAADSRNALTSVAAEANSLYVIRGWVRKLTASSADSLAVLRKSIDALSTVTLPPTFIQRERDSGFEFCRFRRIGQRGLARSFAYCAASGPVAG